MDTAAHEAPVAPGPPSPDRPVLPPHRRRWQSESWVLTDGSVGMENQGLAVAEALGLPATCKRVRRAGPFRYLPTWAQVLLPPDTLLRAVAPKSDRLAPPWPRVLISIGRHSVPLALAVKQLSHGRTLALHIQNPKVESRALRSRRRADARRTLTGANVVTTFGRRAPGDARAPVEGRRSVRAKAFALASPARRRAYRRRLQVLSLRGRGCAAPGRGSRAASRAKRTPRFSSRPRGAPARRTPPSSRAVSMAFRRDLGRRRRKSLFRLSRSRRGRHCHERFRQHGHGSSGHRKARLCLSAARAFGAACALSCRDAAKGRDADIRRAP